jgi:hypothetical protein
MHMRNRYGSTEHLFFPTYRIFALSSTKLTFFASLCASLCSHFCRNSARASKQSQTVRAWVLFRLFDASPENLLHLLELCLLCTRLRCCICRLRLHVLHLRSQPQHLLVLEGQRQTVRERDSKF